MKQSVLASDSRHKGNVIYLPAGVSWWMKKKTKPVGDFLWLGSVLRLAFNALTLLVGQGWRTSGPYKNLCYLVLKNLFWNLQLLRLQSASTVWYGLPAVWSWLHRNIFVCYIYSSFIGASPFDSLTRDFALDTTGTWPQILPIVASRSGARHNSTGTSSILQPLNWRTKTVHLENSH